ncbi:ALF repeat-containing protein, partial [Streptomyces griseoincarnatus]
MFLDQMLPAAQDEDNRFSLFAALPLAGRAVREGASAALVGGRDAVSAFLDGGFERVLLEDLRVEVFSEFNNGGTAVRREAAAALNAGTEDALRLFLDVRRYSAQAEDDRAEVFKILATASPQVAEYARRALSDGSPEAASWFLESGQFIARVRDDESATIEQLVAIVEEGGRRAALNSEKAVLLSD